MNMRVAALLSAVVSCVGIAVVVVLATVGGSAHASAVTAHHAKPFKVTSSIDGKKVLPLRTRWIVHPHLASWKLKKVVFLIDGKRRWVEQEAPYVYGGDDNGLYKGFLITTWLTPGRHKFTARAVTTTGRTATHTVRARVLSAPQPPAALAGTWTRTVTQADLEKSGPGPPPAGVWELVFNRIGAWHLDPLGSGLVNQYAVAGNTINVFAPIQMGPSGVKRYGHRGIGGTDCREDGPFGSYSWSVSGDQLTLVAAKDPCGNRRAIWEGVWTRTR